MQRGLTLMEVLLACAVLGFVVAAVAPAIVAGQMQAHDAMREERAVQLADALLEEILSKPYADPEGATVTGPDAGETQRTLFDNCDDYHGYSEALGAVSDAAGVAYPSVYSVFSRSVTCTYETVSVTGLGSKAGLTVVVTVTDDHGRNWSVTRFVPEPGS